MTVGASICNHSEVFLPPEGCSAHISVGRVPRTYAVGIITSCHTTHILDHTSMYNKKRNNGISNAGHKGRETKKEHKHKNKTKQECMTKKRNKRKHENNSSNKKEQHKGIDQGAKTTILFYTIGQTNKTTWPNKSQEETAQQEKGKLMQ